MPPYCTIDHLEFLDELRESGVTNMFGSPAYLRREFPDLTQPESFEIVEYWMNTFTARQEQK